MTWYEIVLVCFFCGAEHPLGCVRAASVYDAKRQAVERWPDARYEEMHIRLVEASLVQLL